MSGRVKDGGPAFPCDGRDHIVRMDGSGGPGMTLRDAAALSALQGFCAYSGSVGSTFGPTEIALRAFEIADAFIAAREVSE